MRLIPAHKLALLVAAVFMLAIATMTEGQVRNEFKTYQNARFDYSIAYPPHLVPQGESENGDGQKFLSQDGRTEMLVYGAQNSLDQSLRKAFEEAKAHSPEHPNRRTTYQVMRRDWFVVSRIDDGRVFYQKTFLRNGVFKTFRIEYDESQKKVMDSLTSQIAASFKA